MGGCGVCWVTTMKLSMLVREFRSPFPPGPTSSSDATVSSPSRQSVRRCCHGLERTRPILLKVNGRPQSEGPLRRRYHWVPATHRYSGDGLMRSYLFEAANVI